MSEPHNRVTKRLWKHFKQLSLPEFRVLSAIIDATTFSDWAELSESVLKQETGLERTAVYEGKRGLEQRGIIQVRPGRGQQPCAYRVHPKFTGREGSATADPSGRANRSATADGKGSATANMTRPPSRTAPIRTDQDLKTTTKQSLYVPPEKNVVVFSADADDPTGSDCYLVNDAEGLWQDELRSEVPPDVGCELVCEDAEHLHLELERSIPAGSAAIPPLGDSVITADFVRLGMLPNVADRLSLLCDLERARAICARARELHAAGIVRNPAGWARNCIEQGWELAPTVEEQIRRTHETTSKVRAQERQLEQMTKHVENSRHETARAEMASMPELQQNRVWKVARRMAVARSPSFMRETLEHADVTFPAISGALADALDYFKANEEAV